LSVSEIDLDSNEFKFEDSIVTVNYLAKYEDEKHLFKFKGVLSETIKKINPELYEKLYKAVNEFAKKRDEIIKKREEEREKLMKKQKIAELKAFKTWVKTKLPPKARAIRYEFVKEEEVIGWTNIKKLKFFTKGRSSIEVAFDDDRNKWEVEDFNYKRRYYKNFENAIERAIELIEDYNTRMNERQAKMNALENFAEATGLQLKTGYKSYGYGTRRRGYTTYHLIPEDQKFVINLSVDYENKVTATSVEIKVPINLNLGVKVTKCSCSFESLKTPEEVKNLVESIKRAKE